MTAFYRLGRKQSCRFSGQSKCCSKPRHKLDTNDLMAGCHKKNKS